MCGISQQNTALAREAGSAEGNEKGETKPFCGFQWKLMSPARSGCGQDSAVARASRSFRPRGRLGSKPEPEPEGSRRGEGREERVQMGLILFQEDRERQVKRARQLLTECVVLLAVLDLEDDWRGDASDG